MKKPISVDRLRYVYTVAKNTSYVKDVTLGHALLPAQHELVLADARCQNAMKRKEATDMKWQVGMRRLLDTRNSLNMLNNWRAKKRVLQGTESIKITGKRPLQAKNQRIE